MVEEHKGASSMLEGLLAAAVGPQTDFVNKERRKLIKQKERMGGCRG